MHGKQAAASAGADQARPPSSCIDIGTRGLDVSKTVVTTVHDAPQVWRKQLLQLRLTGLRHHHPAISDAQKRIRRGENPNTSSSAVPNMTNRHKTTVKGKQAAA
jgi:hypothetical protein